ncbi:MAG: DUF1549 domain-containing protein [Pirellulaceae bacterium]|nr:DUF1549 domain-containing protein [Pirellulaceae bacterium]
MDERLEQPALVMTASWRRTAAALCAAIFAVGGSAYGDDRIEFFEKKIRPVLVAHCYECHGAKKQKGKLRLDSAPALRRGGENGIVIEPGDAASSSLWQALNYDGSEMPPAKQLPKSVIADFKKWIDDGAVDPRKNVDAEPSLQAARSHWAFQPISSPAPPNARSSWAVNPIDLFIDARLRAAGMQPAAAADRLTLARRLYLDLTGLPPTRREIESFVDDPRPDAWERLVDRLLASPQYGERLARQWMDIVRYTETAGHVQDRVRPHAWRYRDWLIDAFNDDLAYDRFVMEHIAGDLVEARPGRGGEQNVAPAATGWMWFHEMHFRPVDPILQRADQVDAQIDVLGKAFLGLTLSCVRCHDHKFDPIVLADYYALAGFFHSTVERHARLAEPSRLADADQQKAVERLRGEIAATIARETKSVRQRQSKKTTDSLPLTEINFTPGAQRKLQSLRDQLSEIDWSFAQWSPAAAD